MVKLTEFIFFQETLSIMLPADFVDMPEEIADIKYQAEVRPQIIKTSPDMRVNIVLNDTKDKMDPKMLPELVKLVKQSMRSYQPASEFYEQNYVSGETLSYGWFDYKGYALDGEIYYFHSYIMTGGLLHHIALSAPFDEMAEWKPVMTEILATVKDLTIKESGEIKNEPGV